METTLLFLPQSTRIISAPACRCTGALLQRHAASLRHLVGPERALIVSGFTRDEADDVIKALGNEPLDVVSEGEWVAFSLTRKS